MRKWGIVLSVGLLFTAAPSAASAPPLCDLDPATGRLVVEIPGGPFYKLLRDKGGTIYVNGFLCDGATVTNTDRISLRGYGGDPDQTAVIDLGLGGFGPGLTNEAFGSDEIEFDVNLGDGFDQLTILGTAEADAVRVGWGGGTFGVPRMNLDADESAGIDADVTMLGLEGLLLYGSFGPDELSAAGGAGTGISLSSDVVGSLLLDGHNGADTITGGSGEDYLFAGNGSDVVKGGPGPDHVSAADGISGNDTVQGGDGEDDCEVDPGDTVQNC